MERTAGGITYTLTRRRVRNINLRVRADGSVAASASVRVPVSYVDAFVAAARRILQQRNGPVQSAEIVRRFKRDVAYQKIITLIEKLAHE